MDSNDELTTINPGINLSACSATMTSLTSPSFSFPLRERRVNHARTHQRCCVSSIHKAERLSKLVRFVLKLGIVVEISAEGPNF